MHLGALGHLIHRFTRIGGILDSGNMHLISLLAIVFLRISPLISDTSMPLRASGRFQSFDGVNTWLTSYGFVNRVVI